MLPQVIDAEGKTLTMRGGLALINHTLDKAAAKQEGYFDVDSCCAAGQFGVN